jgi:hypothetical protein
MCHNNTAQRRNAAQARPQDYDIGHRVLLDQVRTLKLAGVA